jgi:hypothetical protein
VRFNAFKACLAFYIGYFGYEVSAGQFYPADLAIYPSAIACKKAERELNERSTMMARSSIRRITTLNGIGRPNPFRISSGIS